MWANASGEGGRRQGEAFKGIKYGDPVSDAQLMNHPEQGEQKRNDPDSFVLFSFYSLSFLF